MLATLTPGGSVVISERDAAALYESIEAAAKLAGAKLKDVNSDIHASEEYRRAMVPVFAKRALERALARAKS